jgi:hypothetical protein
MTASAGDLAAVADAALVGDPEDVDAAVADALRLPVERRVDELEHVLGHALVHVRRELDEAGLEAVRARLPAEIEADRSGCSARRGRARGRTA